MLQCCRPCQISSVCSLRLQKPKLDTPLSTSRFSSGGSLWPWLLRRRDRIGGAWKFTRVRPPECYGYFLVPRNSAKRRLSIRVLVRESLVLHLQRRVLRYFLKYVCVIIIIQNKLLYTSVAAVYHGVGKNLFSALIMAQAGTSDGWSTGLLSGALNV